MPLACAPASAAASSRALADDAVRRRALADHLVAKRVPFDELRDDIQLAVEFLERIDGADAGMGEERCRARFTPEPLAVNRIARELGRERLQRNSASKPAVGGQIHAAHAASTELANDGIGAQNRARLQRVLLFQQMRRRFDHGCARNAPARE